VGRVAGEVLARHVLGVLDAEPARLAKRRDIARGQQTRPPNQKA